MIERVSAAWQDYRRRVRAAVLVPSVGLVASAAVGIGADRLGVPDAVFYAAAGLTLAASAAVWLRLAVFPCPKCGNWFALTPTFSNPFTGRCLHCGHPKWQFVHYGRSSSDRPKRVG